MSPVLKACIVCAHPFAGPGSRCPNHALPNRTGTYTRTAKQVVPNATRCHLCGGGPRPDDPIVADHIVPRSLGGTDELDNLRPAHRSCNGRRGNSTKAELNWRDRHGGRHGHRENERRLATPAAFREKNSARNRPEKRKPPVVRVTVPPCHYCGKEIDKLEFVYTVDHMLRVQKTKLTHADDPRSARVPVRGEYWVCGEHHRSDEAILEVVKTGAAEQARLARPPATSEFWPRDVLNYDDLRKGKR